MSTRAVQLVEGEFYHVYNRGTDKRPIFTNPEDWVRFHQLLYLSNMAEPVTLRNVTRETKDVFTYLRGDTLVAVGAYSLMPNHFHILLTPLVPGGASLFMSKLGTAYSMYFNRKYDRTGTLFEGAFKSKHADSDVYLKYLYAYIHLNPIKLWSERSDTGESAADFLRNYPYSSLRDYAGLQRSAGGIISPQFFPEYFTTAAEHMDELKEWLGYRDLVNVTE